jgi:hypothetical protein
VLFRYYGGDSTFATSSSAALTQTVNQGSSTTPLSSSVTLGRLKQIYENIFVMEKFSGTAHLLERKDKTYGWQTNSATKATMLMDLRKAVEDGHLELSDPDLIAELRSYTRDDLMDRDEDVRLTTRHFDLLIAAAIAWQMRHYATKPVKEDIHTEASQGQQTQDFEVY